MKTPVSVIEVQNLDFVINDTQILKQISLSVEKNEFVGLIGPNGSGKSTLLKNIYRFHKPTTGAIYLEGEEVQHLKSKEIARRMAVVAQENEMTFDFSVKEIVAMGRYAHRGILKDHSEEDDKICLNALDMVGLRHLKDRSFLSLSGGEKQRIYMASAFAQQSRIIVLDEPTNHLDIGYQLHLMETLRSLPHVTVFTSVHDMNLAARYCDRIIVLDHGKIAAMGTPREVLTCDLIRRVFHVDAEILYEDGNTSMQIHYLRYCP